MIDELLRRSIKRREKLLARLGDATDCYRLMHGIAEGHPGLAIDRYGPILLLQTWREGLGSHEIESLRRVAERALSVPLVPVWNHRNKSRREPFSAYHSPEVPVEPTACELGLRYDVRPRHRGLDPLLFLDGRAARRLLLREAHGKTVLNLFAYTCALGLVAASAGATETWNVDFSRSALRVGERNAILNRLGESSMRVINEDVFPIVRQLAGMPVRARRGRPRDFVRVEPRVFDIVVLDPPRWSKGRFGAVDVVRDYPGLFKPAVLATRPGGRVLATNHAPGVDLSDWRRVVLRTAEKCGRPVRDLEIIEPEEDFPSFDGAPPLKMAWIEV
ncbi:MAG TPA: class I SAM-dependent methyltransferase [Vicinamibacteria bacterium]|nr:class I SAM-dependent methyltransferase [Vicinamibacteria bacterium]